MAKADDDRPLLLDTHIWAWYVEGDRARFSPHIEPLVEAAVARGEVFVSGISVWEIAQLNALGLLELAQDVRTWVGSALSFPGVQLRALTPSIAIESTRLPGAIHRDPADRLLIGDVPAGGRSARHVRQADPELRARGSRPSRRRAPVTAYSTSSTKRRQGSARTPGATAPVRNACRAAS